MLRVREARNSETRKSWVVGSNIRSSFMGSGDGDYSTAIRIHGLVVRTGVDGTLEMLEHSVLRDGFVREL